MEGELGILLSMIRTAASASSAPLREIHKGAEK